MISRFTCPSQKSLSLPSPSTGATQNLPLESKTAKVIKNSRTSRMRDQAHPPVIPAGLSGNPSSFPLHPSVIPAGLSGNPSSFPLHPSVIPAGLSGNPLSFPLHPSVIPAGLSGNPLSFPLHPPCHSRRIKRESIVLSHPPQSWLRSSPPAKPAANRLDLYPFLHNIRPNVKTDQPSSSNRTTQPQYILPKVNTPIPDAQKLKKKPTKEDNE